MGRFATKKNVIELLKDPNTDMEMGFWSNYNTNSFIAIKFTFNSKTAVPLQINLSKKKNRLDRGKRTDSHISDEDGGT